MFSMFDPIGLTNRSGLGLITIDKCEDDDEDALVKIIITLKNQIDEIPKVYHQYQILKLIYIHFFFNHIYQ
jgi:hypothetical protein